MKIGFIVARPTQFEAPFFRFVHELGQQDRLDVFFLTDSNRPGYDRETGLPLPWGTDLYTGYPHYFLLSENRVQELVPFLRTGYSLMIINGYKNAYAGFVAICRQHHTPVALRLDTAFFNKTGLEFVLRRLFLLKIYRQFDHFMVTGNVSRRYLIQMGIASEKISIFSYCVDNAFFAGNPSRDASPLPSEVRMHTRLLVVTKLIRRESPGEVIRALQYLNRPDLDLYIAGDGRERRALEKMAGARHGRSIHFLGLVPYLHLRQHYWMSDLFIHPAREEPWGVSVQEAIAGGCRVVASDKVGAAYDLIKTGENGFIYRSGRHEELAEKIECALQIPIQQANATNRHILQSWNFDAMWKAITDAGRKITPQS